MPAVGCQGSGRVSWLFARNLLHDDEAPIFLVIIENMNDVPFESNLRVSVNGEIRRMAHIDSAQAVHDVAALDPENLLGRRSRVNHVPNWNRKGAGGARSDAHNFSVLPVTVLGVGCGVQN